LSKASPTKIVHKVHETNLDLVTGSLLKWIL